MLTFTEDTPPPRYQWDTVLTELQANPGQWAYIEDVSYRTAENLRNRWERHPVEITMRGTKPVPRRGRRGTMWLRWNP